MNKNLSHYYKNLIGYRPVSDKNTAFLWRHRFLALTNTHQALHKEGIIDAVHVEVVLFPLADKDAIFCTDISIKKGYRIPLFNII